MLPRLHFILVEEDIPITLPLRKLLQSLYPNATVSCVIDLAVGQALYELNGADCVIIHYDSLRAVGLAGIAHFHAAHRAVPIITIAVPPADAAMAQMAGATRVLTLLEQDADLERALAAVLAPS